MPYNTAPAYANNKIMKKVIYPVWTRLPPGPSIKLGSLSAIIFSSENVAQAGRGCAAPAIDEMRNSAISARLRYSRRRFSWFHGVATRHESSSAKCTVGCPKASGHQAACGIGFAHDELIGQRHKSQHSSRPYERVIITDHVKGIEIAGEAAHGVGVFERAELHQRRADFLAGRDFG